MLRNRFADEWLGRAEELTKAVAAVPEQFGWTTANNQTPDTILNWAGESVGLVDAIKPASRVLSETLEQAEKLLRTAGGLPR